MSIHVCKCTHKGREEFHLRYPGMTEDEAQSLADRINGGALSNQSAQPLRELSDLQLRAIYREIGQEDGAPLEFARSVLTAARGAK